MKWDDFYKQYSELAKKVMPQTLKINLKGLFAYTDNGFLR